MTSDNKKQSRRKFIGWGLVSAAFFSAIRFVKPAHKKNKTAKMLTQDGQLVEVDIAALPAKKRKITISELQNWIKK